MRPGAPSGGRVSNHNGRAAQREATPARREPLMRDSSATHTSRPRASTTLVERRFPQKLWKSLWRNRTSRHVCPLVTAGFSELHHLGAQHVQRSWCPTATRIRWDVGRRRTRVVIPWMGVDEVEAAERGAAHARPALYADSRLRGRPPFAPLARAAAAFAFVRRRPPRCPVARANNRAPNARSTSPGT